MKTLPFDPVADLVCARLEAAGYQAYLVGGAVRDLLLSRAAQDLDVATSAAPETVRELFSDFRVIETGVKHGTLTVLCEGRAVEITTFRREGGYADARHPDSVVFVGDILEDLPRRDFTIGAMALSRRGELIDPFGGQQDLNRGILRCVGVADERFAQDALRILRLFRFAATLGFSVEEETFDSAVRHTDKLKQVAAERLFSEFSRALCADHIEEALIKFHPIVSALVPEAADCVGFDQKSVYHDRDVYRHIARTVGAVRAHLPLRLAAFYHDLGKPAVCTEGEDGFRHFPHHAEESVIRARESLSALKAPRALTQEVLFLVEHHDEVLFASEKAVRRRLAAYGKKRLLLLVELQLADALAHSPFGRQSKETQLSQFLLLVHEICSAQGEFTRADLAVDGKDLKALGVPPSPELGRLLDRLFWLAAEGTVKNERETLLECAKQFLLHTGDFCDKISVDSIESE